MKHFSSLSKIVPSVVLAALMAQMGCEKSQSNVGSNSNPAVSSSSATQSKEGESAEVKTADEKEVSMHKPTSAPPSGFQFEPPVRLKAGEEFVSVEAPGYACPTMADVDGDGLEDLVVGQFTDGNMQFCRNIGKAGQPPEFVAAEWIKTGNDRAVVPGVW